MQHLQLTFIVRGQFDEGNTRASFIVDETHDAINSDQDVEDAAQHLASFLTEVIPFQIAARAIEIASVKLTHTSSFVAAYVKLATTAFDLSQNKKIVDQLEEFGLCVGENVLPAKAIAEIVALEVDTIKLIVNG